MALRSEAKHEASSGKREKARFEAQSELAYRKIEARMVSGILAPGEKISESRLAADIQCGRTAVRNALLILRHEGFLELRGDGGTIVTPVNVERQLNLLEVRRPLELLLTELGVSRATPEERIRLKEAERAYLAIANQGNTHSYLVANRAAMDARMAAAHNRVLAESMRIIFGMSRRFWFQYIEDPANFYDAAVLHARILAAIAEGDRTTALAATSALLNFLEGLTAAEVERMTIANKGST